MHFPLPATLESHKVNIRPAPENVSSLALLDKGDTVQVLNIIVLHGEGWCRVYYEPENIEGYILKKYLSIVTPEPVLTASPLPQLTASPIPVTPTPVPVTPMPVLVTPTLIPIEYASIPLSLSSSSFGLSTLPSPTPMRSTSTPSYPISHSTHTSNPATLDISSFAPLALLLICFLGIRFFRKYHQKNLESKNHPHLKYVNTVGMEWFPEMEHYDLTDVHQAPIPATPAEPEMPSSPEPASVPSPETPAFLIVRQSPRLPKPMVDPPHEKPVFSDPSPYQELSRNEPYVLPPPLPPRTPSVSHARLKQKKPKKKTNRPFNYNPEPESAKRVGSLPVHPVSWPRHDTNWQMLPFVESSRLQSIDDRLLRYRARKIRSKKYIGLDYERFIGYLLESNGYSVMYNGALKGVKDGGIDLIASKENDLLLIQCKLYKRGRNIPSGYAYRLKASVDRYCQDHPEVKRAVGYLVTNYAVSAKAQSVADASGLQTAIVRYDRYYPCVKCVSFYTKKGARRSYYYMPWQSSYDKVNVLPEADDCYVFTAREAESLGYHYRGRKYT